MQIAAVLIVFISITGCYHPSTYKISPTPDKDAVEGVYIPKDIDDAFSELKRMLSPGFLREFRKTDEKNLWKYHLSLGMWIRNYWGLRKGSELQSYFNKKGIYEADNMSGIILISFWRHLNNKPIQLEELILMNLKYQN